MSSPPQGSRMIPEMGNQKRCGIVLFDPIKDKYLLVRGRDSKKWGFPKGHMEAGELEEETAIREFLEETGLSISGPFHGRVRFGNNIYFAKTRPENRVLNTRDHNEIDEIKWFPKSEILALTKDSCNFGLSMWRKQMLVLPSECIHTVGSHTRIHGMTATTASYPVLPTNTTKKWFDRVSIPVMI